MRTGYFLFQFLKNATCQLRCTCCSEHLIIMHVVQYVLEKS